MEFTTNVCDGFAIQTINVGDVIEKDYRFNSNNHPISSNGDKPDDYTEVLDKCSTKYWVNEFHAGKYSYFDLLPQHIEWMKEASKTGYQTGQFSRLFFEELDECVNDHEEYQALINQIGSDKGVFVRTETVSLKTGMFGAGPYHELDSIFKSMVTCRVSHCPIREDTKEVRIYLLPWKEINDFKEFRVFIFKGCITAISQQALYSVNALLAGLDREPLLKIVAGWCRKIVTFFESTIRERIRLESYTMDICLLGDNEDPYFIEINSFGKHYSAGSSLFHWILDDEILEGDGDGLIFFRYVV